ncbi:MAG: DUF349 domain-containing protein [Prevotella sp.]|nr:DUF349 domain-containing protein [Prevotella sp.]
MMDSENKALEEGKTLFPVYATKREVLERVKEIAHSDDDPDKDEVDYLKTVFYKMHIAEREASYKEFLDNGGNPETYQVVPDDAEEAFKAEMGIIKERRAAIFRQQEEEKEQNLQRKLEIIEKIKLMVTSPEDANKAFQEFKTLQQEWKEIKSVPATRANELWRTYQLYVEQFYDLFKMNIEAREYDFKKNLEIKTRLCEAVEKLAEEQDIISAFHQLQKFHQEYRETGPVAKELREQIWARFKQASTVINKRHQQHFEELRAKEEENLVKKTALCEKVEAVAAEENKGASDWERHTQEIMDIQAEWKTIGFAPQKMNVKIFERFRAACDDFFGRKAEYFRSLKDTFKQNAEHKRALVEKANAMKDSTDWKSTSDKFIALQKEWKTIGMVPKKLGDQLWEEFLGACNYFFERRNEATSGQRNEEHANLKHKRDIIASIKALAESTDKDEAQAALVKLAEEYKTVGHVPFREKDNLYEEYHAALDLLRSTLGITPNPAKRKAGKPRKEQPPVDERTRLMRNYEQLKAEIQTYENNIGFLSVSSKKGNKLIDDMNRKVEKLKEEFKAVRDRIIQIDKGL